MNSPVEKINTVVVDVDEGTAVVARSYLNATGPFSVYAANNCHTALTLINGLSTGLILLAHVRDQIDAPQFAREIRRSDLLSRKAPIIMLVANPTAAEIKQARDSGVDEVLRKPFSGRDLTARVQATLNKKRNWVEAIGYVGPDRRRFDSGSYQGELRRRIDKQGVSNEQARIGQALKIMKSAIEAIDTEPRQALRALQAQAEELQSAAVACEDFALAHGAKSMLSHLNLAVQLGCFTRAEITTQLRGLFRQ